MCNDDYSFPYFSFIAFSFLFLGDQLDKYDFSGRPTLCILFVLTVNVQDLMRENKPYLI